MAGIRTFVAIPLEEEMHRQLARLIDNLRESMPARAVRWVAPENIHLTLKFLGDVPPAQIDAITEALRRAASTATPFSFELVGFGCFPSARRPRVLWVGIRETSGSLQSLQEAVEKELGQLGFKREERGFSPHLTLGRVREEAPASAVREIGQLMEKLEFGVLGQQEVTSIHLFKSDLRPTGPIYTSLAELPLRNP